MKINAVEQEILSDASLVEQSLAGDRDAFGQIVGRYQSPICALTYTACGNLARSEDLAQEIFIAAWRKLSSLQDPAKFKAWLYGIARNLINNAFRQHTRNPVAGAELLEEGWEPAPAANEPDEQAISKEEETILWHVLSGLPQIYREPMVLFYRQNESVPRVADVMAISEDAVRQRLSRGRALLNERVAKVIQNGLRRSGPANTFVVAVITALPIVAAATTAKGAIVGIVTTKSATSQATGLLGFLKGLASFAGLIAVPAILGSFIGRKLGQDATGFPRHRKSAAKFWRIFGWGLVLLLIIPLLLTFGITGFLHGETRARFLSVMTVWLGLAYPFVPGALGFWIWHRRRQQPVTQPCPAADLIGEAAQPIADIPATSKRMISTHLVLFLTLLAAGLLVFCYADMNRDVLHPSSAELRDLINQSTPSELRVNIMASHYRSIWGESPEIHRSLWVEVRKDGQTTKYSTEVDDATLALLARKGIAYPTLIAGRDYEILGAPGRFLPFLAAFVLAIGSIFLLKRNRIARSMVKQA
jgi:RNA polymerase sigma factor (sigma-70 family)